MYRRPEFLQTLAVQGLRARLIRDLKKDPVELDIFFILNWAHWQARHLSAGDHVLLSCIETAVGEEERNAWVHDVFRQAGLLKGLEDVLPAEKN